MNRECEDCLTARRAVDKLHLITKLLLKNNLNFYIYIY